MRRSALLAGLLALCWVAAGDVLLPHGGPAALTASAGNDGTLTVAGLKFHACPRHSLRALLMPASLEGANPAAVDQQLAAADSLDFERTFDRASDSWTLTVSLPAGQPTPGLVQLWCRACHTEGSQQQVTRLVGSQAVQQPQAGSAAGTLVLVLDGATLPAAAASDAASSARKLLQAAGCTLTVGGQARSFASCGQPQYVTGNYAYTVYATAEPNGAGSLLKLGLAAKTSGGWAGFGLPKYPGQMLGASAVVVWPSGAGAEVAGFKLPSNSYEERDVNAAKGTLTITDSAAEIVAGELRAVFTLALPTTPVDKLTSAGGLDYIYAIGPMGSSGSPGLADHSIGPYPYGGDILQVKAASSSSSSSTPAAAAAPAAEPATVPATSAPAPAPESASSTGSGDATTDGAAGASNCTLQLGDSAAPATFPACTPIRGVGTDYWLLWKSEPAADNSSRLLLTIGLNASVSDGYIAVGFPAQPGKMVGATALILQTCPAASAGCTGGAKISEWYLASEDQSGVNPSNGLAVSGLQAAVLPSTGQLAGTFQIEVDAPTPARRRRSLLLLQSSDGSMPLIFAAGPVASDGTPLEHFDYSSATLPLANATATGDVALESGDEEDALKSAHAWLAAIGWGVLIPMGIAIGRSFKEAAPLWFHLHRALQTLGFIMGTIALGLGFKIVGSGWTAEDYEHAVHRNLGVACTVLGATQFSALVLRPKKGGKYRFAWELWHHWVGRSATVLAIANIYYGILHMWDLGVWTWASYTAVLACIVSVSVVKDTSDWLRARRARHAKLGSAGSGQLSPKATHAHITEMAASPGNGRQHATMQTATVETVETA